MRWPDLFTSRLKRRRADSMGSPSPTVTLILTGRAVEEAAGTAVARMQQEEVREGEVAGQITHERYESPTRKENDQRQ